MRLTLVSLLLGAAGIAASAVVRRRPAARGLRELRASSALGLVGLVPAWLMALLGHVVR